MDQLEPLHGISNDESPPAIGSITAAGDFHSAPRPGRFDCERPVKHPGQDHLAETHDEVVLSPVANVSLLAEEGMSAGAIAAGLGLTPAEVITDLSIAAAICHPSEGVGKLGQASGG